ncbi:hypothetical protein HYX18_01795 [Candidatus Woesearchaeota archaeon]|nr:hypothetical protein [Candidatus Woesearchaeota archaeon]
MIISFFEEFPNSENLEKLELVDWDTKLYLASKSLKEFHRIRRGIKNEHVRELIYWPILKHDYYISPFSKRKNLEAIFNEIGDENVSVLLDAEWPLKKRVALKEIFSFFGNRRLIRNFVLQHNNIYVAEYYHMGAFMDAIYGFLGLHFDPNKFNNRAIRMVYHSLHNFDKNTINELRRCEESYKDKFLVAYGTIARGILKNEPILPLSRLEEDLIIAKELGIREVVIYRLGGLNEDYARLLKQYA